jgi:predicted dehydrogenase
MVGGVSQLRIGLLGAARIAPNALVKPARAVEGVTVAAVAARDPERARAFAARHGVPRVLGSYDELVRDDALDAVYIPLPNRLHAEWALRAIEAGKHVLCEKPFTANTAQARAVADAVSGTALVVMEAFHYRYHPLAERMVAIVRQELGEVRRIETSMCFPLPRFGDIRYQYALAGGALMDAGCYALHCARLLGPGEPVVTGAQALTLRGDPRVDRAMTVDLRYPAGAVGRVHTSMWSKALLRIRARVVGDRGEMTVTNFAAPQYYHRVTVRVDGKTRRERVQGEPTYTCQLRAFAAAVGGDPGANLTPASDAVRTMQLIDAAYQAAGLPLRGAE